MASRPAWRSARASIPPQKSSATSTASPRSRPARGGPGTPAVTPFPGSARSLRGAAGAAPPYLHILWQVSRVAGVLRLIVRGRERLGARITCLVRHLEADEPTCSSTRSAAASLPLRLHQAPHLVVQRPHPVLDLRRARELFGGEHLADVER